MTFMPPIAWLRERFYLNEQGELRRVDEPDRQVGRVQRDGYVKVDVTHDGVRKKLSVHRVVWSLNAGRAVADDVQVDHRDRNRQHNAAGNLKVRVTQRANMMNRSIKGTGITDLGDRFRARISVHGRDICLGTYASECDARRARRLALNGKHPKCTAETLSAARARACRRFEATGAQA